MNLTTQQVFDKVADHLLTQNKKSESNGIMGQDAPSCAYRGGNGLMCAVGCLIPDEVYHDHMEGYDVSHLLATYPEFQVMFEIDGFLKTSDLLADLQQMHDDWFPDMWFERLENLSNRYNLDFSNVKAKHGTH